MIRVSAVVIIASLFFLSCNQTKDKKVIYLDESLGFRTVLNDVSLVKKDTTEFNNGYSSRTCLYKDKKLAYYGIASLSYPREIDSLMLSEHCLKVVNKMNCSEVELKDTVISGRQAKIIYFDECDTKTKNPSIFISTYIKNTSLDLSIEFKKNQGFDKSFIDSINISKL